ncbi:MAG: PhnD/SsuA/transferrin family substrate-binding protein [Planctomycetota bacterium]
MRLKTWILSLSIIVAAAITSLPDAGAGDADKNVDGSISMIVMDPLAAPLSCPCVEGYAQRKYEVLAEHLEKSIGRPVTLTFNESLELALKKTGGRVDIVIGKDSVVRADAKTVNRDLKLFGRLSDQQGSTDQYGMIVVNRDDPAKVVKDLDGYTIIFGPNEADEKHAAPLKLLKKAGIAIPKTLTIDLACSDGACKVIDLGPESKTAAVISSYAQPLLEGCGTIKKGDLRVVAKTAPVPFISAFASSDLDDGVRQEIQEVILGLSTEPEVLQAIESLVGFLPAKKPVEAAVVVPITKKK